MRVAIVESNPEQRDDLARRVLQIDPDATIEVFSSRAEFSIEEEFSIYLLDIHGVEGMSIAREIRRRKSRSVIIFITGFREFMEEAFDVQAFHYLLKPIESEKFARVFRRAMTEASEDSRFILVRAGGILRKIFLDSILFIESDDKKVRIRLEDSTLETYSTLTTLESELGARFFRCHRCYLVNLDKIVSYSSNEIELIDGARILLARSKSRDFRKSFLHYIRG